MRDKLYSLWSNCAGTVEEEELARGVSLETVLKRIRDSIALREAAEDSEDFGQLAGSGDKTNRPEMRVSKCR